MPPLQTPVPCRCGHIRPETWMQGGVRPGTGQGLRGPRDGACGGPVEGGGAQERGPELSRTQHAGPEAAASTPSAQSPPGF